MILRPQEGPQEMFLSSPADIAIFGGAAGGGKSFGLLMEPVRHINNPRFGAVTFRRTFPQITAVGGLWDEAGKIYPALGGTANKTDLYYRFPKGSVCKFAHMQFDKHMYDWQGSQIPLISFDELTHFSMAQFFYMLSRNRSTCGVKPYIRGSCNPDADSWVANFIAWWINQDTGYPIPERAGMIRYFMQLDDRTIWGDTPREVQEQLPNFDPVVDKPKSLTFIPSTIYDNKILLEANPEYLSNLRALPLVERERLLAGNWKIRPSAGKIFNRGWYTIVDAVPAGGVECRFWDFASTERKLRGKDPDFTASVKIRLVEGRFYIVDCLAVQAGPAEVEKMFVNVTQQDREQAATTNTRYMARWEIDPGSAGKRERVRYMNLIRGDAAGKSPQGDKITRAKPLAAHSEAGNVLIVKGAWNEMWLNHMHNQPELMHDDIMDASSGSFNELQLGGVQYAPGLWG